MKNKIQQTITAGGVVLNINDEILVVSQHGTSWSLPKGHVENDESFVDTAKREIYEESGISDLVLVKPLGNYKRYRIGRDVSKDDTTELKTIYIFLFKTKITTFKPIDRDNPDAKWVKKEEVENLLTHPEDKDFFRSIVEKI